MDISKLFGKHTLSHTERWERLLLCFKGVCCVNFVCRTEALLLIDGVVPPIDIVCLGLEPMYTLLVDNRAEVVVKYL